MTDGQQDVWGMMFRDAWKQGNAVYNIRRDDDHGDELEAIGYFRTELPEPEARALEFAKGHVLDVGCGAGPDILWLQDRGFRVTGIDSSAGAVEVARARGAGDVRLAELWDIPTLPEKFDTVIFMANGMGLAGTPEKTGELLQMLRQVTNDGARIIGASADPTATDNPAHLAYHGRNRAAGRHPGQVRIRVEYQGFVDEWFDLLLMDEPFFANLCEQHGWRHIDTVSDGPRYYFVAEKVNQQPPDKI